MRRAIKLARRGLPEAAPNPCVGAVLVQRGGIVAEGWHTAYGKPHAEREAIADARAKDVDTAACDLYVTLEPCNHHGKTPPCTEAVLEAGIKRVYVGCGDPNPTVAGGGAQFLRSRGVEVALGILEQECRDLIADFLTWKLEQRSYCILRITSYNVCYTKLLRVGVPRPLSARCVVIAPLAASFSRPENSPESTSRPGSV